MSRRRYDIGFADHHENDLDGRTIGTDGLGDGFAS